MVLLYWFNLSLYCIYTFFVLCISCFVWSIFCFFGTGWLNDASPYSSMYFCAWSRFCFSFAYEADFAPALYKMWFYIYNYKYQYCTNILVLPYVYSSIIYYWFTYDTQLGRYILMYLRNLRYLLSVLMCNYANKNTAALYTSYVYLCFMPCLCIVMDV
jgi:hypothetical protein